ncbi:MAG: peptide ligase PGM1-related protein, partial [Gemmatimonadota bacterium]|nr:peptide ligase PGM1-related protein [Gemmatimonadota bacterium]
RRIESGAPEEHTSVVVPSLTFDVAELAKIQGIQFYEERSLASLLRMRDPRARVVFVTSQPVHPEIVAYYLGLLPGMRRRDAERRLALVSTHDARPRPLTEKILARPRLIERLRSLIGDPENAYLTCFNTTELEAELAGELGVPLNGADPSLGWIGTKSGSRRVFEEAGVPLGPGESGVRTKADVVDALDRLREGTREVRRAVIKLDDSFAGAGNALYAFPAELPKGSRERRKALEAALGELRPASGEPAADFLAKLETMGGVVELYLESAEGKPLSSPSVQLRIDPEGEIRLLSTHEQVLEGPIGQTYVGCRFPADERHRNAIRDHGFAVARVLRDRGVIGRFGIDFLSGGDGTDLFAIEINLRMGGTTFPFMTLESLVEGTLDPESGEYVAADGVRKRYFATDNLRSAAYAGLTPEDFFEIIQGYGLLFDRTTGTGPVFHMIGALSEHGRVGVTCIADRAADAEARYRDVVAVLDRECPADRVVGAPPSHPMGLSISRME